jgi:hypothetical protein
MLGKYFLQTFEKGSNMIKLNIYLRLFLIGFFLAFLLIGLTNCPQENSTGPIDDPAVETAPMKQYNEKVITAFQSGDKQKVVDLMYDEYKDIYSSQLDSDPQKMQNFANALEKRKIIFANAFYAEYEVEIDGQIFTIAYSNTGDGNWKLQRF